MLAVHEAHADFVWCSLQRLGVRPSDLDDVFQEVFIVVHKRLHTFDGSSQLTTWLYGVCLRVAAAHRRRAWFRRETPDRRPPRRRTGTPPSDRPDELCAARQGHAMLARVLDAMDIEKRAVFVMFEIDELPSEAIADDPRRAGGDGVVAALRRAQAVPGEARPPPGRAGERSRPMSEPTRLRDEGPDAVRALLRDAPRTRAMTADDRSRTRARVARSPASRRGWGASPGSRAPPSARASAC